MKVSIDKAHSIFWKMNDAMMFVLKINDTYCLLMSSEPERPYAGIGKKCPFCGCCFSCEEDYKAHARVCAELRDERMGWTKGQYGEEICANNDDRAKMELASAIRRNGGSVQLGKFMVRLSKNGRWFVRSEVMFR